MGLRAGPREEGKPVQVHQDKVAEDRASNHEQGSWKRRGRKGEELCSTKDLIALVPVLVLVPAQVVVLDEE